MAAEQAAQRGIEGLIEDQRGVADAEVVECGVAFAALFVIGAFRNVTPAEQGIADVNNALLPLWVVVLGASLIWYPRNP